MGTNRLSVNTTSPSVTFYLQADEIGTSAAGNTSTVRAYLVASASSSSSYYGYHDATVTGTVGGTSFSVSGSDADIAQGSGGWTRGPWDITVPHNADGSGSAYLALNVNYPNASDTGGATSGSLGLTPLGVAPGAPSNVNLTRNSDTKATLTWTRNEPSNGAASSYDIMLSTNGGGWVLADSISPGTSYVATIAANQKVTAQVRAFSAKGASAFTQSNTVWTTPGAPTNAVATRNSDNSITVSWVPHVAYSEYEQRIRHGVVEDGTTTWDADLIDTVGAGVTSFRHTGVDLSDVHVYAISAQTTDAAHLVSGEAVTGQVQLIAPPNAPTLANPPQNTDVDKTLTISWVHNPVDTTGQTAYEFGYSTDGGNTWSTSGKVSSEISNRAIPAGTYPAGTVLTIRVRTWGQASTGGSDGAGASPWSRVASIGFKTAPTVTVTTPAPGSVVTQATLRTVIGFAQEQGATLVRATLLLYSGGVLLETKTTTGTSATFTTRLADGGSYMVRATVLDSNGLTSAPASAPFTVDYVDPVAALVYATYTPDDGTATIDIGIGEPRPSQADVVAISVTRTINGEMETLLDHHDVTPGVVTVLDVLPTIHGLNVYRVTTWSSDGASTVTVEELETTERRMAFMSTGEDWRTWVRFWGNLKLGSAPTRESALVAMAGRPRPIALFGRNATFDVTGTAVLIAGETSTVEEVEAFLLDADYVCYRDPSGRRVFGLAKGSFSSRSEWRADFSYTVSEAS